MSAPRFKKNYLETFKLSLGLLFDFCDTYEIKGKLLGGRWVKKNKRAYQEDYLTISEIEQFQSLSPQQKDYTVRTAIKIIHDVFGNEEDAGSTACTAIVSRELNNAFNISVGNIGDSSAYLVDPETNTITLLNKWHKPEDPEEKEYIEQHGGVVELMKEKGLKDEYRLKRAVELVDGVQLKGDLGMSRSIGDTFFQPLLNREADITQTAGNATAASKKFLIVSSDGLTDTLDEKAILSIVKQHQNQSPSTIAGALGSAAIRPRHSSDNTSVAVIPIHDIPNNTSILAAIFDGHGGRNVSYPAGRNFSDVLKDVTRLSIHYDGNIPKEEIDNLKRKLLINKNKVEAFKKIYSAMRESQTGWIKHDFLTEENERLSDMEMLNKIRQYANEHRDSRTAKAWNLAREEKYFNHCNKDNLELVREIHQLSFEASFFSKSNLFLLKSPIPLAKPEKHSTHSAEDLKEQWERRMREPDKKSLTQTIETHALSDSNNRTAVIRKMLG